MAEFRFAVLWWNPREARCHWQLWCSTDAKGGDARVEREDTFPLAGGGSLTGPQLVQAAQHAMHESLREQGSAIRVPSLVATAVVEAPAAEPSTSQPPFSALMNQLCAALQHVHTLADALEDLANEDEGLSETELPFVLGDMAETAKDDRAFLNELLEEVPHA